MPDLNELGAKYQTQRKPSLEDLFRMYQQMNEAQGISDAVPRGPPQFKWAPPAKNALPELPTTYQPAHRWDYGQPVRMA